MERKKLLRQSIVYWLEVSTWEFSFSLDFHFWSNVSCARSADKMHHCYFHNFFFFSFLDKPEKLVCRINTEWVEKASKQTVTNCISGNKAETSLNTFVIFFLVLAPFSEEEKQREKNVTIHSVFRKIASFSVCSPVDDCCTTGDYGLLNSGRSTLHQKSKSQHHKFMLHD